MSALGQKRRIRDYFTRHKPSFIGGIAALIATQTFSLVVPNLLKHATNALAAHDFDEVRRYALYLLGVAVVGAVARIASRLLIFNAGREVEYDIRNDLFAVLSRMPPSFYAKMPSGQVMSRAINDLTQVRLLLGPGLLNLINTALVYAVVVPLLIYTDAVLAMITLVALPLLVIGGRAIGRRMYEDSKEAQDRLGNVSSKVQENLTGIATVRVYRREAEEERTFRAMNDRFVEVNMRLARSRGLMFPLMGLCGAVGGIMLLWQGGLRLMDGRMDLGTFVAFNAYLTALTWPTIALGWMISLVQRGFAAMDRINDVFTAVPGIVDGPLAPAPFAGKLEIKDLTVAYKEGQPPALENITTTFEPGKTIVVVGRTGSGKSTLVRALGRLLEVPKGTIFLDGVDVNDLPVDAVRQALAVAPQEAFLFSRTIAENVAFGRPEAPREVIDLAASKAGLGPDLTGMKEGLETVVGERGITLSGGQRQRAALARALLLEAPILVLDDTLSAVDTETESRILARLAERTGGPRTTILVTHRLACASMADRILVLDEGRIVEQGTEPELLAKRGVYAEMHKHQRLKEAIDAVASHRPEAAA